MKVKSLVALAMCMCALAAAPSARAGVKNPGTLFYAHMGEMVSLDPVYPYDGVSQGLIFNVYETLIRFKGSSLTAYEPLLATQVPSVANGLVSKDGLTYKFPIRKGVRFHDGSVLTPEDVRYSIMRFMLTDPAGGPASLLLEPILGLSSTRNARGVSQVDFKAAAKAVRVEKGMVVITLKKPFAPFLSIMARWSYVMSKGWCMRNGEWDGREETWRRYNNLTADKSRLFEKMNGTGPFKLDRWDRQSKRVFLSRFDGYWSARAKLAHVVLSTVNEFGTRRLMLEAGDADIIDVPRTFEAQLRQMRDVKLEDNLNRLITDPVFFFTFNINRAGNPDIGSGQLDGRGIPPNFFADKNVRKAFAYSFDYNAFINQSLKGKAARANGPIPPGIMGFSLEKTVYNHDLKKAREYFQKAWGGQVWNRGFRFTLTYNTGSEVRQAACEIMKRNVESLNPKFKIDLRGLDWPSYLDKAQRRLMPIFARGWTGDYPDPHNFIFPFFHSQGRYGLSQGYSNPALDKLINEAVTTVSSDKRSKLYSKIISMGVDDAVQVYTVHPRGLMAHRSWLKGFTDNAVFMGIYFYPLSK